MSRASERGRAGEEYVCEYLIGNGWSVLDRNYRVKGGEIDVIAEKDGTVAFVEVKTRKFGSLTGGLEAVDRKKRGHLVYAADRWTEHNPVDGKQIRFDAAEVVVTTEEHPRVIEMKYFEDAFDAFSV